MKIPLTFAAMLFFCLHLFGQYTTTDVYTNFSSPFRMTGNGSFTYVSQPLGSKVSRLNLNDPSSGPITIANSLFLAGSVLLVGQELYISNLTNGEINKVDVSIPNSPLVQVVTGLNAPYAMAVIGNDMYIVDGFDDRLVKIDLTQTDPIIEELIVGLNQPIDLQLKDSVLYIAEGDSDKISKVDLRQPNLITEDVITNVKARNLLLDGNILYFSGESKVSKIDISQVNPTIVEMLNGVDSDDGMYIFGNELYVCNYGDNKIVKINNYYASLEEEQIETLKIYPNPSNDYIKIEGLKKDIDYSIYDITGSKVKSGRLLMNSVIDISMLSKGFFFLNIGENATKKLKFSKL